MFSGRRREIVFLTAGLAGAGAVVIRFDFAPAVVLGSLPILTLVPRRSRVWFAAGLLAAGVVYALQLVVVGPDRIARLVGDLAASAPGRRLPIPPPWEYLGGLLALTVLTLVACLVLGAVRWRRGGDDPVPRVLVGVGLFGLSLLPWVLSRPDGLHVRPVSVMALSLIPPCALVALGASRSRRLLGRAVIVAALLVSVGVSSRGETGFDRIGELRGIRTAYRGFLDDDSRQAVQAVVGRARELARPGDSLFVGPLDLRRSNYGPTYIYFLLRHLRPASYYMELNPGTANREGSGLADELRRADWLILTSEWDNWSETNESSKLGPNEPNEVVRDLFCLRLEHGQYRLYERCDRTA